LDDTAVARADTWRNVLAASLIKLGCWPAVVAAAAAAADDHRPGCRQPGACWGSQCHYTAPAWGQRSGLGEPFVWRERSVQAMEPALRMSAWILASLTTSCKRASGTSASNREVSGARRVALDHGNMRQRALRPSQHTVRANLVRQDKRRRQNPCSSFIVSHCYYMCDLTYD
jgi:hypothetical protein